MAPAPAAGGGEATSVSGRAGRLRRLLAERELDQLVVTDLTNVGYLTGFSGTNGACLVSAEAAVFLTDFRYAERAEREVGEGWERPGAERELLPALAKLMRGRVGFEDGKLTVRAHRKLAASAPDDVELVPAGDLVEAVRAVKEPGEIERIAAAAELADAVYGHALERGLVGRTELEIARECVERMRAEGAEPSFPPIVAAGPNGSLPHAEPGEREILPGDLVVFDMGCELEGYCSDCTRTFATGAVGDDERGVYELVRSAQSAALDGVGPGITGAQADALAREPIDAAGHGGEFGHGLGHGCGIEIHEAPRLAKTSDDELRAGNVVTIEPGIYVAGRFGVRIEDLVVIGDEGIARNLSSLPKELAPVD